MQNSKLGSVVDGHDDLVYKKVKKHRFGRFAVEQAVLYYHQSYYYSVWENAMGCNCIIYWMRIHRQQLVEWIEFGFDSTC
eukprot:scaffold2026_cov78-Cylindrotheca_fusiformis.AAC.3